MIEIYCQDVHKIKSILRTKIFGVYPLFWVGREFQKFLAVQAKAPEITAYQFPEMDFRPWKPNGKIKNYLKTLNQPSCICSVKIFMRI